MLAPEEVPVTIRTRSVYVEGIEEKSTLEDALASVVVAIGA